LDFSTLIIFYLCPVFKNISHLKIAAK